MFGLAMGVGKLRFLDGQEHGAARFTGGWSRPASAARMAKVLPAPTSPVIRPSVRSLMHQVMRAAAWAWDECRCSIPGARSRPKACG